MSARKNNLMALSRLGECVLQRYLLAEVEEALLGTECWRRLPGQRDEERVALQRGRGGARRGARRRVRRHEVKDGGRH